MTIVEFLLTRIAEDEEVARAAQGEAIFQHQTGRWSFETIHDEYGPIPIVFAVADGGGKTQVANLESAWEREQRGAHIARHDPSRVLAECETKRRIVNSMEALMGHEKTYFERMRHTDEQDAAYVIARTALRTLASVYADHPGYDPAWTITV